MSTLRTDNLSTTDSSLTFPLTDIARLTTLAASGGAALIGFGDSTVADALGQFGTNPESHGAVGDGIADDTAAIVDALATGLPVVGTPGKIYGVTGNIILPSVTVMRDISFKQLSPDAVDRRTLYMTSGTKVRLSRVVVDRNGTGAGGQLNNSAAIYIANCPDTLIEQCEVIGNNFGDGLVCTDSTVKLVRNYVHDMTWGTPTGPAQTDDVMQGILLVRCTGECYANRVERLNGQWSGQSPTHRWTRGIALGGCYDMTLSGNITDTVDQGSDYSGDLNNRRISTLGGHALNSRSWGFKAANTVTDSVYVGCIARRSGLAGFVASAPNAVIPDSAIRTQNITYVGCTSMENGYGGFWPGDGQRGGFSALNSVTYPDFPRGIKWVGCRSYGSGTSQYGFRNDAAVPDTGTFWNEAIDCDSRDSVVDFAGMNQGILIKSSSANQSIPNNSFTTATLPDTVTDRMAGGSTNTIRRMGIYNLSGHVNFTGNTSGIRTLRILVNGNPVVGGVFTSAPNASGTGVGGTLPRMLNAGDTVRLEVFQDSGVSLDITSAYLSIAEISKGQSSP